MGNLLWTVFSLMGGFIFHKVTVALHEHGMNGVPLLLCGLCGILCYIIAIIFAIRGMRDVDD